MFESTNVNVFFRGGEVDGWTDGQRNLARHCEVYLETGVGWVSRRRETWVDNVM